jgi:hypothetical protein
MVQSRDLENGQSLVGCQERPVTTVGVGSAHLVFGEENYG